jgi:hypothetical protein
MPSQIETIEQAFLSFRLQVIPPSAPEDQIREMRWAFYAGAWSILTTVRRIGEPDVSEDRGVAIMEQLVAECQTFVKGVE